MKIYEILVPTISNEGKPFRLRYHRVWDKYVRNITGGLSILTPIKGQWLNRNSLYIERMIPVRIACTEEQINIIADYTAKYYKQKAIMYYIIGQVIIKNYEND